MHAATKMLKDIFVHIFHVVIQSNKQHQNYMQQISDLKVVTVFNYYTFMAIIQDNVH